MDRVLPDILDITGPLWLPSADFAGATTGGLTRDGDNVEGWRRSCPPRLRRRRAAMRAGESLVASASLPLLPGLSGPCLYYQVCPIKGAARVWPSG
jgi:hypothetical protein